MSEKNLSDNTVGENKMPKQSLTDVLKENKWFFIGLGLAVLTCIIFWMPYSYTEIKYSWFKKKEIIKQIYLLPDLKVGLVSLLLMGILYARRIISFPQENKAFTILSFIINLTLISIYVRICFDPFVPTPEWNALLNNTKILAAIIACIAVIMFGVKEIAKLAVGIVIILSIWSRIDLVSDAMKVWGYIALLLTVISLVLQQNINFGNLVDNLGAMYSFGTRSMNNSITEAEKEGAQIKHTITNSLTGVTNTINTVKHIDRDQVK